MSLCIINPLNTELNPICHLLALLGCATIVVVSRLRVKSNVYVNGSGKKIWQPCLNVSWFLKSGTEIKTVGDHKNKPDTGSSKASRKAKRDENNYLITYISVNTTINKKQLCLQYIATCFVSQESSSG